MDERLPGVTAASAYLSILLARPGPYRPVWEQQAKRLQSDRINIDAVSRVVAAYRDPLDPTGGDYRSINDTIKRALDGTVLTIGLLNDFVAAFEMNREDADLLRNLLRGTTRARVVSGSAQPPPGLYRTIGPRRHQTLSLNELHEVGLDRLPARHRTIQTIRATADGVDHYAYPFDTNAATVEVVRGGEAGEPYRVTDTDFYAVDVNFGYQLRRDDTATFEYVTTFKYTKAPAPECRRGVFGQTDSLLIEVRFHTDALPVAVWWAEWNSLEHTDVKQRELVPLRSDHSVHRQLESVRQAIVGFYWQWD